MIFEWIVVYFVVGFLTAVFIRFAFRESMDFAIWMAIIIFWFFFVAFMIFAVLVAVGLPEDHSNEDHL